MTIPIEILALYSGGCKFIIISKGRDNISISLKLINQPGQTYIICLKIRTRLIITEATAPLVCNLTASFVKASAQCWASSEIQNFLCPEKILPFESQTNKGVIRQNNFKISQRTKERFQMFQYQRTEIS